MYYGYEQPRTQENQPKFQTLVDPYVVETLKTVVGQELIIQTTKDTFRGVLKNVKPDHIMIMAGNTPFFIRIQQIVSIMPND